MRSLTRLTPYRLCMLLFIALWLNAASAMAQDILKPYILVSNSAGDAGATVDEVKQKLAAAGFEVVGEYSPYPAATIVIITSPELKSVASKTEKGGFGAVQRVSVTQAGDKVQVAYTNPRYMASAYRMKGDLSDVASKLEQALGAGEPFGAEGLSEAKLRKYHYMFMRPYFDDTDNLGHFSSYDEAVRVVENGLRNQSGGVSKVYRVDIPGKQETLFGVHMTHGCSGDQFIMDKIDFGDIKSTPHLPYEVLVSGSDVYALPADFRIAISFPDLSMVGSNSFFSIMCAPGEIRGALQNMVNGKPAGAE